MLRRLTLADDFAVVGRQRSEEGESFRCMFHAQVSALKRAADRVHRAVAVGVFCTAEELEASFEQASAHSWQLQLNHSPSDSDGN